METTDVEMESPPSSQTEVQSSAGEKPAEPGTDESSSTNKQAAATPSEIPRIATSELSIDEIPIGRGGYGYVYRATHETFGTVAIKTMIADGILPMRHQRVFQSEGRKLWQLSHSSVVQLLALIMEEGNYSLVLEYMHLGSLTAFLTDFPSTAPCLRVCILRDVAAGMTYLHTLNPPILHLDLKSDNILVNRFIRAKITDFGLAQWKTMTRTMTGRQTAGAVASAGAGAGGAVSGGETGALTERRGTVSHVPPEVWSNINTPPSLAYDVYGFGIVIWETLTGERPFSVVKEDIVPKAVLSGQRPDLKALPKACPKAISNLMKNCWEQQADKRPKFQDVLKDIEACFRSIAAQVRKALSDLETEIQTLYSPEDLGGDTNFSEPSESLLDLAEVIIPKKLADIDQEMEEKKKAEEASKAAAKAAVAAAADVSMADKSAIPNTAPKVMQPPPKPKTTLDTIKEDSEARAKILRQVLRDPVQLFIMEKDPNLLKSAFQIDDSIHAFLRDPEEMKKVFAEDPQLKYEMMRRGNDYLGWLYTPMGAREGFRRKFPKRQPRPELIEAQVKKIQEQEEAERKREEEARRSRERMMREGSGTGRQFSVEMLADILHTPRSQVIRQITMMLENPSMLRRILSDCPPPHSLDPKLVDAIRNPDMFSSILQSEPRLLELAMREDRELIARHLAKAKKPHGPRGRMIHPMMLERELRGMDLDEDDMEEMMMGPRSLRSRIMMDVPYMRGMREMDDPMEYLGLSRMRVPGRYMDDLYGDSMEEALMGKPPQKKAFLSKIRGRMFGGGHRHEEPKGTPATEEHTNFIVDNIGDDWKKLGLKLGFASSYTDRVDSDAKNTDQKSKIQEMMNCWKRRDSSKVTVENLAKGLRLADHHALADKLVAMMVRQANAKSSSAPSTASSSTVSSSSSAPSSSAPSTSAPSSSSAPSASASSSSASSSSSSVPSSSSATSSSSSSPSSSTAADPAASTPSAGNSGV